MKFDEGVRHQTELINDELEFTRVTGRQGRPCFLGQNNPLARLRQQCRIKAAELYCLIVNRLETGQAVSGAHGRQHRRVCCAV